MTVAKFNVNDYIRIRLTDRGRDARIEYWRGPEMFKRSVEEGEKSADICNPGWRDEGRWIRFQMWDAMRIFGKHCRNGLGGVPFETEIEIELQDKAHA